MPLYEYECESCGKRFERIQKFSDQPIEQCIHCSGPVFKVLSPPALVFKGTGWYVTDYAKKNTSLPGNGDKKNKPQEKDKTGESTDKKTDTSEKVSAKSE